MHPRKVIRTQHGTQTETKIQKNLRYSSLHTIRRYLLFQWLAETIIESARERYEAHEAVSYHLPTRLANSAFLQESQIL
jgi:hypothetical protein